MSDKISGFIVTFSESVSDAYVARIKAAILLFDGIASVDPVVEDVGVFLGASQERHAIMKNVIDFVTSDFGRKK